AHALRQQLRLVRIGPLDHGYRPGKPDLGLLELGLKAEGAGQIEEVVEQLVAVPSVQLLAGEKNPPKVSFRFRVSAVTERYLGDRGVRGAKRLAEVDALGIVVGENIDDRFRLLDHERAL